MSIPGGGLLSPKEVMGFPCSYLRESVSLEIIPSQGIVWMIQDEVGCETTYLIFQIKTIGSSTSSRVNGESEQVSGTEDLNAYLDLSLLNYFSSS